MRCFTLLTAAIHPPPPTFIYFTNNEGFNAMELKKKKKSIGIPTETNNDVASGFIILRMGRNYKKPRQNRMPILTNNRQSGTNILFRSLIVIYVYTCENCIASLSFAGCLMQTRAQFNSLKGETEEEDE